MGPLLAIQLPTPACCDFCVGVDVSCVLKLGEVADHHAGRGLLFRSQRDRRRPWNFAQLLGLHRGSLPVAVRLGGQPQEQHLLVRASAAVSASLASFLGAPRKDGVIFVPTRFRMYAN
eukprot:scaffold32213_cov58-Phaeocystis_antarctica.AAC.4